ncbi:dienelactone hydrolase family protein [Marinicrinis lubricantis]|uniref:Dienelactone hydrolase family protein n=1 Tax=Marinicrinis lubricantis TaxID=2086470 RepID=A0ABW1ILI6_9BACL
MTYSLLQLQKEGIPRLLDGIETCEAWEQKRSQLHLNWIKTIGGLPERREVQYAVRTRIDEGDHVRLNIVYSTSDDDEVTAYLLIPAKRNHSKNNFKSPAVLALHPTAAEGKEDVATMSGRENRQYGLELVRRGYVVLAPDCITAGERIYPGNEPYFTAPFYEKYPQWTAVGKMIFDHLHGLDILCSLPYVDEHRIGAIGHSLGGYNALFAAAVDTRITAIVTSCGFSTFTGDPDPYRWGQRDWFSHFPLISESLKIGMVPFEFHEIAALAAPAAWFNWSGTKDPIFPHWPSYMEALNDLQDLYQFLGVADQFMALCGACGHDFPPAIREMAYRFLDKQLEIK